MGRAAEQTYLTPEEYLERERAAEIKSAYYRGETFAMSGASRAHNVLATNLIRELSTALRGGPCEIYPSDMRVKVSPTGLYTYPDVVVVWGEPRFEDEHVDTLLNPALVVEVLSPSTEGYDRGRKFEHYRRIETLRSYVLIAQERVHVEHFVRQDEGRWLLEEHAARGDTLRLPEPLAVNLALADLYDRLTFEEGDGGAREAIGAPPGPRGSGRRGAG